MATAVVGLSASRMSVGRVFDRAFATVRTNPLVTIGLTILFGGLPAVAVEYLIAQVPPEAFYMTVGSLALPGSVPLALTKWFLGLVIGTICLGAMTRPVVAYSYGRKAGFGESLMLGFRFMPQLLFLGIIFGLSVVVGTTFLIVPGFIVYVLWMIAAPALADEGDGVFLSLSRSQELSEGARWKCLAVLLLACVIVMILAAIGAIGVLAVGRLNTFSAASTAWLAVLVTSTQLVWATVQASLYVELRDWKEGPGIDNLEDVFA